MMREDEQLAASPNHSINCPLPLDFSPIMCYSESMMNNEPTLDELIRIELDDDLDIKSNLYGDDYADAMMMDILENIQY